VSEGPLRIAQLMKSASRNNGGVFSAAHGVSIALALHVDFRLQVFAIEDERTTVDRHEWDQIPVHAFPGLPPKAFSYAPGLSKAVRSFRPDVVHQHGVWIYTSLIARTLASEGPCAVVISLHNMLSPWALRHKATRKHVALWLYERENLAKADCIHALTKAEAECVRALGLKTPICVIPNGIDLPAIKPSGFRANSGTRIRELLFLGRLHPQKGVLELLKGWAHFCRKRHKSNENWRLNIVGWGEHSYRRRLKSAVAELGVSNSVSFAGPKFGDALWAAYAQADAFILPSHSEAMPMTVLEAWACGLPVIMTSHCGLPEGFISKAAIETSTRPEDIAEAIAMITRLSPAARQNMGGAGREIVKERYSWTNAAASFQLVYKWLAGRGPMPDCVMGTGP
jgi:glycosyltransferase involved in cell wall biosynthesis